MIKRKKTWITSAHQGFVEENLHSTFWPHMRLPQKRRGYNKNRCENDKGRSLNCKS